MPSWWPGTTSRLRDSRRDVCEHLARGIPRTWAPPTVLRETQLPQPCVLSHFQSFADTWKPSPDRLTPAPQWGHSSGAGSAPCTESHTSVSLPPDTSSSAKALYPMSVSGFINIH